MSVIHDEFEVKMEVDRDTHDEEVNSTSNKEDSVFSNSFEVESSSVNMPSISSYNSRIVETSEGEICWVPEVEDDIKPLVGKIFGNLNACIEMYESYAYEAGFETRLSTQKKTKSGVVTLKYIVCNKQGTPQGVSIDTLNTDKSDKKLRISSLQVTGCEAQVIFKLVEGSHSYRLIEFEEKHNHELNAKEHRHLSRKHRKLGISEMMFIQKVSTSNIGPTRAHHIYSNIQGSHKNTHGTVTDFKNYKKKINCFIGSSDSQMLVTKMENRKQCIATFSFEYKVQNSELAGLFWADETAKGNFKEFGDIISFDATYRTNRYNMIFVPFTAIDNHKKTVSLGAGMLMDETADSYEWLLKSFLKTFGRQPLMVVTDQDAAMKKAIEVVFTESRHRLCMWHITQKLPLKVGKRMFDNTDFKKKFNNIVWNISISTKTFEKRWFEIMKEFKLEDDPWFTHMYDIRSTWIPAYFTDLPMSGLMRTTSRSESENSFFSNFTNGGSTLVHFMMSYEAAMERQGSRLEVLDHQTHNKRPPFITPLLIEQHACKVYTRTIFLLVQKEIHLGTWSCFQHTVNSEKGCDVIVIKEKRECKKNTEKVVGKKKDKNVEEVEDIKTVDQEESENGTEDETGNATETGSGTETVKKVYEFKVIHNKECGTTVCSCMAFPRYGFLCRHIFCVFNNLDVEEIPEKYILRRWKKDLIPPGMRTRRTRFGESSEECERLGNELHFLADICVDILGKDEVKLAGFVDKVRALKDDLVAGIPNLRSKNDNEVIEQYLGVSKPSVNDIENPPVLRYKGCGRDSRFKSAKETAIEEYLKPKRKCGRCGKMTRKHDKRNCEKKQAEKAKAKAMAQALESLDKN